MTFQMNNIHNIILTILLIIFSLFISFTVFVFHFLWPKVYLRTRKKRPIEDYIAGGVTPEWVKFETIDGIPAYGIFYTSGPGKRPLVIILHGYAHHMGANHLMIERILKEGWNVFTFDFRGCGESDYPRTTIALREPLDVMGANMYLKKRTDIDFERIAMWGGSMGAATAIRSLPFFKEVKCVVADSPFYDINTVISSRLRRKRVPLIIFPYIILILGLIVRGNMWKASTVRVLRNVNSVPILFIHGDQDIDNPFSDSERLFKLYQGPKEFLRLEGIGHYDHEQIPAYLETSIEFIRKYLK